MKSELTGISYYVSKKAGKAAWDYRMLRKDDRILIAVSGGKDSLALLSIMKDRQRFVPVRHEIIACHVDMGFDWVKTDTLKDYFEGQQVPYVIANPVEKWAKDDEPLNCFWCSWTRRKTLFKLAGEMGCNKIALGHHMDDIAETLLLNLLFNGEIGTMKPNQEIFNGRLTLIRPLAYVEEKYLVKFAKQLNLPVIKSECPRAETSKRRLVKGIISEVHRHNKNVKKNIFRSLQRIREEYLLGTDRSTEPGRFEDEI